MALRLAAKEILTVNGRSVLAFPLRVCSTLTNGGENSDISQNLTLLRTARKRRDILQSRKAIMKIMRQDKNVEKAARSRQLQIPLDTVKKEWSITKGLKEVAYLAKYYGIFRDIFGGMEFMPVVWLDVHYNNNAVHRGNILEPTKCLEKPTIHFSSDPNKYHAILLLNPEGCWPCSNAEVLHWMLINIPGNKIDEGKELRYLSPMPWKGSGFHRFCFVLFEQDRIITDEVFKMNDINRFEFQTRHLLSTTDVFKPVGLSWFQSQWDDSVTATAFAAGVFEPQFEWQELTDPKEILIRKKRTIRSNKYRIKFTDEDILL